MGRCGDVKMGHHDPVQDLEHSIAIVMLFSQDDNLSGYTVAKSSPGRDHFQGWSRHLWSGSVVKLGVGLHHCCANLPGDHCYSTVLIACLIPIYILPLLAVEEHKQVIPCWRTRHAAIPSRCGTGGHPGLRARSCIARFQLCRVYRHWYDICELGDLYPCKSSMMRWNLARHGIMCLNWCLALRPEWYWNWRWTLRPLEWQHGPLADLSDIFSHYAVGLRQLHQFFFSFDGLTRHHDSLSENQLSTRGDVGAV